MKGPIVVGIDDREPGTAVEFAAALARRLERALVLLHAAGDPPAFPYGNARLRELVRRRAIADGERLLAEIAEPVRERIGESRVEFGEPAETLRRVAHELGASLIVVSPRRRRQFVRALWRGTSGAVAASSPCPVVIVPRSMRRADTALTAGGPIVVGSDGTAESGRAIVVAEALADRLELPILPVGIDVAAEAARDAIRYRNVHRRPGDALAEIARRVRGTLLVVGTAGGSWLSGSVAQHLIGAAPVPLVVVPEARHHA
jgi:nucleotide-binding universal stress UspA family protein